MALAWRTLSISSEGEVDSLLAGSQNHRLHRPAREGPGKLGTTFMRQHREAIHPAGVPFARVPGRTKRLPRELQSGTGRKTFRG